MGGTKSKHEPQNESVCHYEHKHNSGSEREACHKHVEKKMKIQADACVKIAKATGSSPIGYGGNNDTGGQKMLTYN